MCVVVMCDFTLLLLLLSLLPSLASKSLKVFLPRRVSLSLSLSLSQRAASLSLCEVRQLLVRQLAALYQTVGHTAVTTAAY